MGKRGEEAEGREKEGEKCEGRGREGEGMNGGGGGRVKKEGEWKEPRRKGGKERNRKMHAHTFSS